jgi:hypothetical protein
MSLAYFLSYSLPNFLMTSIYNGRSTCIHTADASIKETGEPDTLIFGEKISEF